MDVSSDKDAFIPFISTDDVIKNGVASMVLTKYMAISMMEKFRNKSFEELHLEDYNARVSGFCNLKGDLSISKQNNTDDIITNENNQLNVIKNLVDELVSTLCKLMLKMNHIAFKSSQCAANETQNDKSGSFPSVSIEPTPSSIHSQKFDNFLANSSSSFNPTTVTNSSKFKFTPATNNFSFTPTTNPFFCTKSSTTVSDSSTFNSLPSNKNFFSTPNTNLNTSTATTTWSLTPITNSKFAPTQTFFSKTPTTETKSSVSNSTFPSPTTSSIFKPSENIFNTTAKTNFHSAFKSFPTSSTITSTSSSSFFNKTSTSQSKFFNNKPTIPNHNCWSVSSKTNETPNKAKSSVDHPFRQPLTTPVTFNSLPSSSFNNNAKASANFFDSNSHSESHNSFPTQTTPYPSLFKSTSSSSKSNWSNKVINTSSSSAFSTEKSEPVFSTPCSNGIILPPTLKLNSNFTSIPEDKSKNNDLSSVNKESEQNTNKEPVANKELNDDDFVSSIVNCIESLKLIAFEANKSKLIGICESSDTNNTNILKSAFIQLRVMNLRFLYYEKCAFVGESAGILNTTIKNNILGGKPFNAQLYYCAIVLCCLKEDIDSLPLGELTQVEDNGIELSDAQKQKIALARAFYADQNIYFLHNAFNKIGSKDARFIFETLILGALKEKVIILIDDKLSYFDHCHKIYIFNKGKAVEMSDHKSLLETNPFYASLLQKNDSNNVVTEDKTTMDQSSNANENSIASIPRPNQDNCEINGINQKIQDIKIQADQNDNTELKKVIQEKRVDNTEVENTLDRQLEDIEGAKKSEQVAANTTVHYIRYIKSIGRKENDKQDLTDVPKKQEENKIGNIETKKSSQSDEVQEKQLSDSVKDEIDGQTLSINVEKDEVGNDFEIC